MYEDACSRLHEVLSDLPRYSFFQLDHRVPADGVYFLFESAEGGHEGQRIVRIGSHTGTLVSLRQSGHLKPGIDGLAL
jgi:hypothetical protein